VLGVVLGVSALFQVFLIGTMPIGSVADASWMLPLSLLGSLAMFATLIGATLVRTLAPAGVQTSVRPGASDAPVGEPIREPSTVIRSGSAS